MSVNEDLYNGYFRTPKLKNNQLRIFKNASNVCFKAALFSSGNLCGLLPILFLILIFWGDCCMLEMSTKSYWINADANCS